MGGPDKFVTANQFNAKEGVQVGRFTFRSDNSGRGGVNRVVQSVRDGFGGGTFIVPREEGDVLPEKEVSRTSRRVLGGVLTAYPEDMSQWGEQEARQVMEIVKNALCESRYDKIEQWSLRVRYWFQNVSGVELRDFRLKQTIKTLIQSNFGEDSKKVVLERCDRFLEACAKIWVDSVCEWRNELLAEVRASGVEELREELVEIYRGMAEFFEKAGYCVEEMPSLEEFMDAVEDEHAVPLVVVPPEIRKARLHAVEEGLVDVDDCNDWKFKLAEDDMTVDDWEMVGPFYTEVVSAGKFRSWSDICGETLRVHGENMMGMREFFAVLPHVGKLLGRGVYLLGDKMGASGTFMFVLMTEDGIPKLRQVDKGLETASNLNRVIASGKLKMLLRG